MLASDRELKEEALGGWQARKFLRYEFRRLAVATIYPPAGEREFRPPQICYIHTKDMSKGGISLLHPVPLFLSQRVDLKFLDGPQISVAIKWIREMERDCYMMGCEFVGID